MNKIINFLKTKKISIFFVLFVITLVFYLSTNTNNKEIKIPSPINTSISDFKGLQPGKSTEEDINNLLGGQLDQTLEGNFKIAEYKSTSDVRNNVVVIENGIAKLIKEIIAYTDKRDSSEITYKYGNSKNVLYPTNPNSSYQLYVYPENGIAYLGHEKGGMLEIWYFEPTSIENFINLWAKDYLKTKSTNYPQY